MSLARSICAATIVAGAAVASPALCAAALYSASTSCGTSLVNQAAPTTLEEQCGDFRGTSNFKAVAATGSLGSRAGTIRGWPDGVPGGGAVFSHFSDDSLLISWAGVGSAPAAFVPVRMRFDLGGAMEVLGYEGWAAAHAMVQFSVDVPGNNSGYSGNTGTWVLRLAPENNAVASNWTVIDGGFSHVGGTLLVDVTLETAEFSVPVGTPFGLNMYLTAGVLTQHGGAPSEPWPTHAAFSNFGNTASIAIGREVFLLPEGYTANAGDYLVNNRFVTANGGGDNGGGGSNGVPEPGSLALLAMGLLGLIGATRKGRAE